MSFQQAGRRRVVPDVGDEIYRSWLPAVVRRFSTPGARFQKRIRIVDSCGDVFSDPGANPGASTISNLLKIGALLYSHSVVYLQRTDVRQYRCADHLPTARRRLPVLQQTSEFQGREGLQERLPNMGARFPGRRIHPAFAESHVVAGRFGARSRLGSVGSHRRGEAGDADGRRGD